MACRTRALRYSADMISEEIRTLLQESPFRAFTVHFADGKSVKVSHHDAAWLLRNGALLFVEDDAGKVHHITVALITQLTSDSTPLSIPEQPTARG